MISFIPFYLKLYKFQNMSLSCNKRYTQRYGIDVFIQWIDSYLFYHSTISNTNESHLLNISIIIFLNFQNRNYNLGWAAKQSYGFGQTIMFIFYGNILWEFCTGILYIHQF